MTHVIPIVPEMNPAPDGIAADAHVASLVVQVRPESLDDLEQQIQKMPECTCYKDSPDTTPMKSSVLVVVMEVATTVDINRVIATLDQLAGVLNVNLVYHYSEPAQSMTDETEINP